MQKDGRDAEQVVAEVVERPGGDVVLHTSRQVLGQTTVASGVGGVWAVACAGVEARAPR